ncbi:MAG: hypothetical protein MUF10_17510 [Thermoanaerobaculaceae bacterium]|nr:hypothetical protein [Thermoanaerobaculaceae bacterium]
MYDRLIQATEGLEYQSDEYCSAFLREIREIKKEAATPGTVLNELLVKK